MGKKNDGRMIHKVATKSWWSGRVTAPCGASAEGGTWERTGWLTSGPRCPICYPRK